MSATVLHLISLNIEGDRHLSQVMDFFNKNPADIYCVQEVLKPDFEMLKKHLQLHGEFLPLAKVEQPAFNISPRGEWGLAVFSPKKFDGIHYQYYYLPWGKIPTLTPGEPNTIARAVLWSTIQKGSENFTIATTHFTWSDKGETSQLQLDTYHQLEKVLDKLPEIILCGDFNTPRGKNKVWKKLSQRYTDNIPQTITTTIDPHMHKAGPLQLVVDGLFTSPQYHARWVKVISRVSDHQAILAQIERVHE